MSDVEGIRVLHVDDDRSLTELVAEHLTRIDEAFEVLTEASAREALERVEDERIDCIVSDQDMPGMNGLEFLRAVRETDDELPFILFTGKGSEEIAAEAITAGVTEYLQKEVGGDQFTLLANRIRRAVGEQRARSALEESERMFSTLISNLPGMVYRCRNEAGWPMEFVSEGAREVTGYEASTLQQGEVTWGEEIVVAEDRGRLRDEVERALDASEAYEVTYRIETRDGERRWVWERGRAVDVRDGVEILEGFVTDITARKEREGALEAEREFTRTIIDALEDVFYVVGLDGSFLRWNDRMNEVTGYSDDELGEIFVIDLFPEEYEDVVLGSASEAKENGSAEFEAEIVTKRGERRPMEFRSTYVEVQEEGLTGICGIARDVSNRQARERKLERYRTIVETVGDPVYALDEEGKVTFGNEAFEELTGYDPESLVGEPVAVLMTDADFARGEELISEMLSAGEGSYRTFEMDVVTKGGDRIPCENHIALLPMDDGTFRGTAGIIRDITDRKERERRLEEFASVVSHDLRNPLNVIQGRVELAKESGATEHLTAVEDAAGRMERFIDELLTLARQGEGIGDQHVVDLEHVARECWAVVDAPGAELVLDEPGKVEADPDRLRELIENLFRNAIEHGADGTGAVTVRVGPTTAGFFVEDDGQGIPADRREAVLERGYTTSSDGTGLGLAIVADVVDAHDWSIEVTESDAGGARFEISV